MPILSFETRFASAVTNGEKMQTIRSLRKRPIKVGDRLHFFTGAYRASQRKRLSLPDGVVCTEVHDIEISRAIGFRPDGFHEVGRVKLDGHPIHAQEIANLLAADGFSDPDEFFGFFTPEIDTRFNGQLIRWKWWGEPINATDPKIWKQEAAR